MTSTSIISEDAISGLSHISGQHFSGKKLLLIGDDTTWLAAGEQVEAALQHRYQCIRHSLGASPLPLRAYAEQIASMATTVDGLLAIGSGTVNDITKYAAYLLRKPYIAIATAASMNGYNSENSSLKDTHSKQSFAAAAPRAVIADLSVIAQAPWRMTAAGLADTLCRTTVETDMLLSHWVLGTPYPRDLFDRLRRHEKELLKAASNQSLAQPQTLKKLMEALLDAGEAMTNYGSSAPASQGEHMIAHLLESHPQIGQHLHGEMIAVTTVTMSRLQRDLIKNPFQLGPISIPKEFAKAEFIKEIDATQSRINQQWPDIQSSLCEAMLSTGQLEEAFAACGLPTTPQALGIEASSYANICSNAYASRDRFTFLDIAAMR